MEQGRVAQMSIQSSQGVKDAMMRLDLEAETGGFIQYSSRGGDIKTVYSIQRK